MHPSRRCACRGSPARSEPAIDVFAEAAKIVMKRHEADTDHQRRRRCVAVRFGLRMAFCRASEPAMPRNFAIG